MRTPRTYDLAFYVGSHAVTLGDLAKAIAVQEGRGELFDDEQERSVLLQAATDIIDRAFRYARERPPNPGSREP